MCVYVCVYIYTHIYIYGGLPKLCCPNYEESGPCAQPCAALCAWWSPGGLYTACAPVFCWSLVRLVPLGNLVRLVPLRNILPCAWCRCEPPRPCAPPCAHLVRTNQKNPCPALPRNFLAHPLSLCNLNIPFE